MSRADETEAPARLAAQRLLGHLEGERLIPRFIDSYIMGFDRKHLKNPPDQFLARSNQLGRLALALLGRLLAEKGGGEFYRLRLGPLRLADNAYAAPAARAALFRQQVAPLLDPTPSMQDKAEHAGQKFYEALDKVAEQVVRRVFSAA